MTLKTAGIVVGYLTAGIVAGTLTVMWIDRGEPSPAAGFGAFPPAADSALEQRFVALRADVDRRLNAIEEQLVELAGSLQASGSGSRAHQAAQSSIAAELSRGTGQTLATGGANNLLTQRLMPAPDATERLVASGFTSDRAEWIMRRSEELRLDRARLQYEAQHQGQPDTSAGEGEVYQRIVDPDSVLRDEIGDAEYERYLSALGQPTSVALDRVLSGSPAEQAGLRAGDVIVGYGGQRVFNIVDLNAASINAPPGQAILVDVRRDGQMMQVALPGGPVGIESSSMPRRIGR